MGGGAEAPPSPHLYTPLPKQSERERSHYPTSAQSSEVGESLPKSSFNPNCCEDGVAVSNIEASACIEKNELLTIILHLIVIVFKKLHRKFVSYK